MKLEVRRCLKQMLRMSDWHFSLTWNCSELKGSVLLILWKWVSWSGDVHFLVSQITGARCMRLFHCTHQLNLLKQRQSWCPPQLAVKRTGVICNLDSQSRDVLCLYPSPTALWFLRWDMSACVCVEELAAAASPTSEWSGNFLMWSFNSSWRPFRIEGKVIHDTDQVPLLTSILWWEWVLLQFWFSDCSQGTLCADPFTLVFILAWMLHWWQLKACCQTAKGLTCGQSAVQMPCL